jgi:hypothetical protein
MSKDHEQPDLSWQPEILHAPRRHRRLIRRHGHDDPLLEWRLHTRRLKFEPLPSGYAWNLPETIQPAAADPIAAGHTQAPRDSDRRDDTVWQTIPST